jgi:hypothetical protein
MVLHPLSRPVQLLNERCAAPAFVERVDADRWLIPV